MKRDQHFGDAKSTDSLAVQHLEIAPAKHFGDFPLLKVQNYMFLFVKGPDVANCFNIRNVLDKELKFHYRSSLSSLTKVTKMVIDGDAVTSPVVGSSVI